MREKDYTIFLKIDVLLGCMQTIYKTRANEIDPAILDSIKALYSDKQIEISVMEQDTTEYLLSSEANREQLLRAIDDIEHGRRIITPDQEQFQ